MGPMTEEQRRMMTHWFSGAGVPSSHEYGNPGLYQQWQQAPWLWERPPGELREGLMGLLGTTTGKGVKAALDMSKAARMARAKAQGYNITAYKGGFPYDWRTMPEYRSSPKGMEVIPGTENRVPQVIAEFNSPGNPYAGFFGNKEVANRFASLFEGGAVFPVRLKFKNPKIIDAKGKPAAAFQFEGVAREHGVKGVRGMLKEHFDDPKIDGVIIRNTSDEGTIYVPRNPAQVRSEFAAFDPKKATSPDMMAAFLPFYMRDE